MITVCVLIPIYNNKETIVDVLEQIAPFMLPCLIVNDGSDLATRQVLETQAQQKQWLQVLHLPLHCGKGAAVQAGLRRAHALGYSHALLIDADGQHNAQDIPRFVAAATAHPEALILGRPVFGDDAPRSRVIGRKISQFWVSVETLSCAIGDPLFGLRVYPVAASTTLITNVTIGSGMEFDTEIAVRLYWAGVPMQNVPTTVFYPRGGLSHFRAWRDNLRLSWLHTRLFFCTIPRIPRLWRLRTQRVSGAGHAQNSLTG
jgi:glycosyltransferase involved in cell wall biosynthesis